MKIDVRSAKTRGRGVGVLLVGLLMLLLGATQGSGGCDTGCGGGCESIPPPPQNDAVWCDIQAIPCGLVNLNTNRCAAPACDFNPNACGVDAESVTRCDPRLTTCRFASATMPGGNRVCFDHNTVSPDQACQGACTNLPNTGKVNLARDLFPLDLVFFPLAPSCEGHANLGTGHAAYNATYPGSPVPNYLANGCLNDGPAIEGVHPNTNAVTLSGGGSVQSAGNGIPPKPMSIKGGHFHLSAPDTSCNALENDCPVVVTEVEIDFDDIEGDTGDIGGGGTHALRNSAMFLNNPFQTPSGIFFPPSGTLPATFSFPLPPGIVFDAIGTGDGTLIGTTAASNVELFATIFLDTGTLVFDYDLRETVNGSLAEMVGTATTDQVIALAPVVTSTPPPPVDATSSCSASVTLSAAASSPLGFPVTVDYFVDTPGSALNAGASATFSLAVGTHTATIVASDPNGGMTRVEHTVTVNDRSPPVFDSIPATQIAQRCANGTVRVNVPTARSQCSTGGTATVTGTVIRVNGATVSIPVVNGAVNIAAGTAVIRWVARSASGVTTTFDQTVTVVPAATIYGSRGVSLADRSTVNGTIYSGGGGIASVGNDSIINGSLISLSPVQLRDRVRVTAIQTNAGITRGNGVVIGSISTTTPVLPPFPTINQQFTGTQAITVAPDGTQTLAPGQYGAVTVFSRGRLVLSAGVYVFTALDLEPQAVLVVPSATAQNVQIFVRDNVIYRGRTATASGALAALLLGYTSSNQITIEREFTGAIIAPNATLNLQSLNNQGAYNGGFFARQVNESPGNTTNQLSCQ